MFNNGSFLLPKYVVSDKKNEKRREMIWQLEDVSIMFSGNIFFFAQSETVLLSKRVSFLKGWILPFFFLFRAYNIVFELFFMVPQNQNVSKQKIIIKYHELKIDAILLHQLVMASQNKRANIFILFLSSAKFFPSVHMWMEDSLVQHRLMCNAYWFYCCYSCFCCCICHRTTVT